MTLTAIAMNHTNKRFRLPGWPPGVWWKVIGTTFYQVLADGSDRPAQVQTVHLTTSKWELWTEAQRAAK